jgi:hypothetical protein
MATYKVVRADLRADRATILDCLTRNEPDVPRVPDQVAWHLERNPHGEGRVWLLLTEPAGKVVGASALVMRKMYVDGEARLAGRTWGVSVDKDHRTLGPALQLAKGALGELERDVSFLYVLPYTKAAGILFARVGYKRLSFLDRHVRVLRSRQYLQNLARHKLQHPLLKHPLVSGSLEGPLATLLAPVADGAIRARYDRPWARPRELIIDRVNGFDRRFDDLWERALPRYRLLSDRSSESLAWRFRRSWDSHVTLGFWSPGAPSRLLGYTVATFDRRQSIVHDFFLEDPELAAPALWLLVDWLRGQNFESICIALAGAPALLAAMERHWFVNRTDHDRPARPPKPSPKQAPDAPKEPPAPPAEEVPDELFFLTAKGVALPDPASWHFLIADDV